MALVERPWRSAGIGRGFYAHLPELFVGRNIPGMSRRISKPRIALNRSLIMHETLITRCNAVAPRVLRSGSIPTLIT